MLLRSYPESCTNGPFHHFGKGLPSRLSECVWILSGEGVAERVGFEPTLPCGKHAFQACAFSHSAISPALLGNLLTLPYCLHRDSVPIPAQLFSQCAASDVMAEVLRERKMKTKLMRFLMGVVACFVLAGAVVPASAQVVVRVGPRHHHRHYYHHHYHHYR
jgi:hypothetical protein